MASTSSAPTLSEMVTPSTIYSLLSMTGLAIAAFASDRLLLPASSTRKTRALFIWSVFDFGTHFLIEAPYLYACFFISTPISTLPKLFPTRHNLPMTPPGVYFLNDPSRLYGAYYGDSLPAKLWQEYGRADKRWAGADLTIISLEILTCGVMAPLSVLVCYLLAKGKFGAGWFWAAVVATGELYGGFMTFAPEWLAGSPNLDTSNWIFLYVYLAFMNGLWVILPLWILYQAYFIFTGALNRVTVTVEETKADGKKKK